MAISCPEQVGYFLLMTDPHPLCLALPNRPAGSRWAIPDVHGHPQTLEALVREQIRLQPEDQLFFLGDYIDRGPDNAGVIDLILDLQQSGYQVHAILGNHEDNLLYEYELHRHSQPRSALRQWIEAADLLDHHHELAPTYRDFMTQLPYYIELDQFYLVHAGFRFEGPRPFADRDAMLRMRGFVHNPTPKTIVHGHQPTDLAVIQAKIAARANIVPLDNGCYAAATLREAGTPPALWQRGHLLALNLDTWQLLIQGNVD
jgi:serine/threonine protein phosphatase 1